MKSIAKGLGALLAGAVLTACGTMAPAVMPPVQTSPYTQAERETVDPGARTAPTKPAFTLTDQFGNSVSLAQFRGKVVLLSFDDDECTTICPLTDQTQVMARDALGKAAAGVVLLAVNANPLHTSVQDVMAYSKEHGLTDRWLFLTGSDQALGRVWKMFGISVQVEAGDIDHTPALFLIDATGRVRRVFLTSADYGVIPLEAAQVAKATAALLPGKPTPQAIPKALGSPVGSPKTAVDLAALTGGAPVHLGPQKPHLVAFFASWAEGAQAGLGALGAYDKLSRTEGLPTAVGVDVLPAEPGIGAAQKLLQSLPAPLPFPVATDATGRVADAYGVLDIPWFVLVKDGRIVWHHDGWLTAPALEKAVTTALGR